MGQNTVVTALITDPSGNPYKNCSFDVSLVNLTGSGTLVNISGSTFQTQYNGGSCDSTGTLVQPLFDSTVISPAGTQWKFNICDITGKTCFSYTAPACPTAGCITGASINISAAISAVAPSLATSGTAGTGTNNTFTGTNTFSGPLVLTGTDTGNQAVSGNKSFSGSDLFSGALFTKYLNNVRIASQFAGADWCAKVTAAATDLSGGGEIWVDVSAGTSQCAAAPVLLLGQTLRFIQGGSYILPNAAVGIQMANSSWIRGCGSTNCAILVYPAAATGIAVAFGNGTLGTSYSGIDSIGIQLNGSNQTAITLDGSTANSLTPTIYTTITNNFITGQNLAGTTGIKEIHSSWATKIDNNVIVALVSPYDWQGVAFSTENTVFTNNKTSCRNNTTDIGANFHQAAGPGEMVFQYNEVNGCFRAVSVTSNSVIYNIQYNHFEQNAIDIVCNGVTTTGGGSVIAWNATAGAVGVPSVRSIQFTGCQGLQVGPNFHGGTYSTDILNVNNTSSGNMFIGYANNGTTNVFANGAANLFLNDNAAGRVEVVGSTLRATRDGALQTQFIELDASAGIATLRGSAGIGNEVDIVAGATTAAKFINTGNQGINWISTLGTACTNGELALSAGWGTTATVTAVAGTGQTCHWTITSSGTGQAANPTITDTLTNALPTATTVCDMRMEGGTGTNTLIQQTTLSATAPVFTFNGTPVAASTYIVVRRCGP